MKNNNLKISQVFENFKRVINQQAYAVLLNLNLFNLVDKIALFQFGNVDTLELGQTSFRHSFPHFVGQQAVPSGHLSSLQHCLRLNTQFQQLLILFLTEQTLPPYFRVVVAIVVVFCMAFMQIFVFSHPFEHYFVGCIYSNLFFLLTKKG